MHMLVRGVSSGVLLKEVAAFQRCPSVEVSLYIHMYVHISIFTSNGNQLLAL